ncbi:MAG TPA: PAS domain S-box protein [Blastocatellia bacterium]|nr:PAS domain S-box protein [Blastocatellia bacterium]
MQEGTPDISYEVGPASRELASISKMLSTLLDKQAIMEAVCRSARELTGADGACFILREGETVHYSREDAVAPLWAGRHLPITNCVSGWSMLNRAPVVIEDVYSDERVPAEHYRPTFVKSLAMMPINRGNPIGAIGLYWGRNHRATEEQLSLLESLADLTSIALANADLFEEARRARADAEGRAEELQKHADLIDQTYDALFVWELGGRITFWNRAAEHLYGYSMGEALGKISHQLLKTTHLVATAEFERDLKRDGRWEGELQHTTKDGRTITVESRCVIAGQNGRSYVLESNRDITERKLVEEARDRLAAIVETSDDAILSKTMEGIITSWNKGAERLYGYAAEEVIGKPVSILMPPERADDFPQIMGRLREGNKVDHYETIRMAKDGRRIDVSLTISAIKDAAGNVTGASAIARDISERTRFMAQERTLRSQAEKASRLKDEFLATISHELRTPLNAIVGWASMLRTGRVDPESTAQALEVIERNAKAQSNLIDDLLDVSRIITGKLRLSVQEVELAPVIQAALDATRPAADAKNVRLQAVLDPNAGPVSGDPDRLQQVVWNLVSNAVKFTPKGGRVHVRLERINSRVEITVSDTGQGISADFLPYVFDRFRQSDATLSRAHGGLGLGLAIVRHLVEQHGGTVSANSPGEGQGATFSVKLPLMIVHHAGRLAGEPSRNQAGADVNAALDYPQILAGARLLVVEDEPDARELIKFILEQCESVVKTSASASEAIISIEDWKPDVLVSDIEMPGESGYELIRQVRDAESGGGNRLPAVALTAHARTEDRMRALSAGYDDHIAKPVEPEELMTVIASLLRRSRKS